VHSLAFVSIASSASVGVLTVKARSNTTRRAKAAFVAGIDGGFLA
jgi:hypothetical protein